MGVFLNLSWVEVKSGVEKHPSNQARQREPEELCMDQDHVPKPRIAIQADISNSLGRRQHIVPGPNY